MGLHHILMLIHHGLDDSYKLYYCPNDIPDPGLLQFFGTGTGTEKKLFAKRNTGTGTGKIWYRKKVLQSVPEKMVLIKVLEPKKFGTKKILVTNKI